MIFRSAEEFFTDTKPCKTHIYTFSKKHTAIKIRERWKIYQNSAIKTDKCYPNGNSATDAEKPIRVDIRFHYSGKDNVTEYQFGYVKQKIS